MKDSPPLYLDNAATSFPKPASMIARTTAFLANEISTTKRRGHVSRSQIEDWIEEARSLLLHLIEGNKEGALIFTLNATDAINMALRGVVKPHTHVITGPFEHAAVSRTLTALQAEGYLEFSIADVDENGLVTPETLEAVRRPNTSLIALGHASNVTGNVVAHQAIGAYAKQHHLLYFLDASQSVGACPLSAEALGADLLAFSGHKSLLGPPGIGCLYVHPNVKVRPSRFGGVGVKSELDLMTPTEASDYEVGTQNVVGLVGLHASLLEIKQIGLEHLIERKNGLTRLFIDRMQALDGVRLYGNLEPSDRLPLVSFTVGGLSPVDELGPMLEHSYGIIARSGLHCSPWSHKQIGTFPTGTVRMSFGAYNTEADVHRAIQAVEEIQMSTKEWY